MAYKDGIIAADTLCCWGGIRVWQTKKIIIGQDGVVAAAAGASSDCYAFEKWIKGGRIGELLKFSESFEGLWFLPSGEIFGGDEAGAHDIPADVKYLAIGCGAKFAQGAMAAGASAAKAVQLCIKNHDGCGGEVQTAVLKEVFQNINQASAEAGLGPINRASGKVGLING